MIRYIARALGILLIALFVQLFVRFELAAYRAQPGETFFVTWLPFMEGK